MNAKRIVTLLTVPFAALVIGCGRGAGPDLPDESTFALEEPDDAMSSALAADAAECGAGGPYAKWFKHEVRELNEASKKYVDLYRGVKRLSRFLQETEAGVFEGTWSGPRGSLTMKAVEAEDGKVGFTITAQLKDEDAAAVKVVEGWVAADRLSGHWDIFKKGEVVRTVDWSRTALAGGVLTAHWQNLKNGKTADFVRDVPNKSARLTITQPGGNVWALEWNIDTKAGKATRTPVGAGTPESFCWDANLCRLECAQ